LASLSLEKWSVGFGDLLTLNSNGQVPIWVGDQSIRDFFSRESKRFKDASLSSKAGIGVY